MEEELRETGGGPGARTAHSYEIADLDDFSDAVLDLAGVTGEFGVMCMNERSPGEKVELRRRFMVFGKRVVFRVSGETRTGALD